MIERFSVQISSSRPGLDKSLRDKATTRIYQAALLHRVAVLVSTPRGNARIARSVVIADSREDGAYIDRVVKNEPMRLVGFYELNGRSHRELLNDIAEDLAEIAYVDVD